MHNKHLVAPRVPCAVGAAVILFRAIKEGGREGGRQWPNGGAAAVARPSPDEWACERRPAGLANSSGLNLAVRSALAKPQARRRSQAFWTNEEAGMLLCAAAAAADSTFASEAAAAATTSKLLHNKSLSLGPNLRWWPAGLRERCRGRRRCRCR